MTADRPLRAELNRFFGVDDDHFQAEPDEAVAAEPSTGGDEHQALAAELSEFLGRSRLVIRPVGGGRGEEVDEGELSGLVAEAEVPVRGGDLSRVELGKLVETAKRAGLPELAKTLSRLAGSGAGLYRVTSDGQAWRPTAPPPVKTLSVTAGGESPSGPVVTIVRPWDRPSQGVRVPEPEWAASLAATSTQTFGGFISGHFLPSLAAAAARLGYQTTSAKLTALHKEVASSTVVVRDREGTPWHPAVLP